MPIIGIEPVWCQQHVREQIDTTRSVLYEQEEIRLYEDHRRFTGVSTGVDRSTRRHGVKGVVISRGIESRGKEDQPILIVLIE